MPYTPNYAAGDVLTAAAMNSIGEAWSTFPSGPTWTSLGTAPTLGNGTFTGRYCQINKVVIARYVLSPGSTTTYGTGIYYFSLPVTANSNYATRDPIGVAQLYDNTIADYLGTVMIDTTARCLIMFPRVSITGIGVTTSVPAEIMSPTIPYTFGNGDSLRFSIIYQAA